MFALGDATDLPTSKAGSVTHFEAEVLTENIARFLAGEELDAGLRRPRELLHRDRLPQGPADRLQLRDRAAARAISRPPFGLPLLRESRLNHLGKLMFQWVYWHALLPGRDIPGSARRCRPPARNASLSHADEEDEMTMTLIADAPVDVDAEGFLTDPDAVERADRRGDRRARTGSPS